MLPLILFSSLPQLYVIGFQKMNPGKMRTVWDLLEFKDGDKFYRVWWMYPVIWGGREWWCTVCPN